MRHCYHVRLIDRESDTLYLPTIRFRGKRRVDVSPGLVVTDAAADQMPAIMDRLDDRLRLLIDALAQRRDRQVANKQRRRAASDDDGGLLPPLARFPVTLHITDVRRGEPLLVEDDWM